MRYVAMIVLLSSLDIVNEDPHILNVMCWQEVLAVDQVSLHLRVLNIKNLVIKLFHFGAGHCTLM